MYLACFASFTETHEGDMYLYSTILDAIQRTFRREWPIAGDPEGMLEIRRIIFRLRSRPLEMEAESLIWYRTEITESNEQFALFARLGRSLDPLGSFKSLYSQYGAIVSANATCEVEEAQSQERFPLVRKIQHLCFLSVRAPRPSLVTEKSPRIREDAPYEFFIVEIAY